MLAGSLDTLLQNVPPVDTVEMLLESCNRCLYWLQEKLSGSVPYTDNALISEICTYIQNSFKTKASNVSMLSETFHLSLPYLSKLFKDSTGYNVLEYICLARLNYAKSLLRGTTQSIACIAQESGFTMSNGWCGC